MIEKLVDPITVAKLLANKFPHTDDLTADQQLKVLEFGVDFSKLAVKTALTTLVEYYRDLIIDSEESCMRVCGITKEQQGKAQIFHTKIFVSAVDLLLQKGKE